MVLRDIMNKFIVLFLLSSFSVLQALPINNETTINVEAKTVVIDEPRGFSVYTGDAKVTQGFLALSAEEIQIFSTKHKVKKIIAKGSKKKPAHYQQDKPNQPRFIEANASTITYFANKQLIRLEGNNTYLIRGFDSFSGGVLHYDIEKDKMIAKKHKNNPKRVKFKIKL